MASLQFLKRVIFGVCLSGVAIGNSRDIQKSLQEIEIAKDQTEIVYQQSRDRETKERMRYTQDRLSAAEQLLQNILLKGDGNWGGESHRSPHLQEKSSVELFRSDSCSGSPVGTLNDDMNCSSFAKSSVWGMKINGVCYDIKDIKGAEVCQNFPAIHNRKANGIFRSDSCRSELVAMIDEKTACSELSIGASAWAVKVGAGSCQNIADELLVSACKKFQFHKQVENP